MYSDDDMLMLSGIQHFRFCPRQWALIHIDQQLQDNGLTAEGQILHKRVTDPFYRQKCGDYISLRSVNIASHELGLYGITDVVELHPTDDKENIYTSRIKELGFSERDIEVLKRYTGLTAEQLYNQISHMPGSEIANMLKLAYANCGNADDSVVEFVGEAPDWADDGYKIVEVIVYD